MGDRPHALAATLNQHLFDEKSNHCVVLNEEDTWLSKKHGMIHHRSPGGVSVSLLPFPRNSDVVLHTWVTDYEHLHLFMSPEICPRILGPAGGKAHEGVGIFDGRHRDSDDGGDQT